MPCIEFVDKKKEKKKKKKVWQIFPSTRPPMFYQHEEGNTKRDVNLVYLRSITTRVQSKVCVFKGHAGLMLLLSNGSKPQGGGQI
jgi:hypothetical protein